MNHPDQKRGTVFLFDVDNTLIDNDRVADDLKRHLASKVGEASEQRYWEIFEQLRTEMGYADYLGALQRYRLERPRDPKLLEVSYFMVNYPFANRLYPESLDAVEYARQMGRPVILSDGDVVFQPRKVDRSGLYDTFQGHVLIYVHKELELEDVEAKYPAAHYVMVDDKVRLLDGDQEVLGIARDDRVSAAGALCAGCGAGGAVSEAGYHAAADRGAAEVFARGNAGGGASRLRLGLLLPAAHRRGPRPPVPGRGRSDRSSGISRNLRGCRQPWVAHIGNNISARQRMVAKPIWNRTVTRMRSLSGFSRDSNAPLTES